MNLPREERERLDREKLIKATMCHEMPAAQVVSSGEGSKSSKHAEKKIRDAKKVGVIVLTGWEDEEEVMVGGKGLWNEKENGGEEDSVVYIGDMLNLEDAMEHVKGREGVSSQPPVVTRSGRVVKTGHLGQ